MDASSDCLVHCDGKVWFQMRLSLLELAVLASNIRMAPRMNFYFSASLCEGAYELGL